MSEVINKPALPDVFALENVKMEAKMLVRYGNNPASMYDQEYAHKTIRFINVLAKLHPSWTFEFTSGRDVKVTSDGELMGQVGERWHGSRMAYYVSNDRIREQRSRGSCYNTESIDKACDKVKKMFAPRTIQERAKLGMDKAREVIENQWRDKSYRRRQHNSHLDSAKLDYANYMEAQFLLWLREKNKTDTLEHKRAYDELTLDMQTIEGIGNQFKNNRSALVVLADGKYIVKIQDNVQLYDDTTLPVELRGKLGMLKLVENKQMIEGIGCRAEAEVFVLVMDEVKDEGI
jgi:hypothetical protein